MNTFMDLFMQGIVSAHNIDDFVATWSNGHPEPDLAVFLGMTTEEYRAWRINGNSELDSIKQRRLNPNP